MLLRLRGAMYPSGAVVFAAARWFARCAARSCTGDAIFFNEPRRVRAPTDQLPSRFWFCFLVAAIAVLFAGLSLPLTDGVTAFYGKIAKNALAAGDWLTFHHQLMPLVDKPPLVFWLMSLSFAAFGTAEWTLRLWHVLLATALAAATYALARLALSTREALAAAAVLVTTMQFFYQSLVPEPHIPLALFLTLAVYWYLRWEREGRLYASVFAWLAAALAVLTVGIAGAVMVALVIGAHLIVDRPRYPRGAVQAVVLGAAAFFVVAAPWFVIGAVRQGRPFVDTFFLGGTLGVARFFQHVQAAPTVVPWWVGFGAYLLLLPLGFLPWTGWLWPALRQGWAARRSADRVLWVCTLWTIVVLGFLSISLGDKSSRYLLPVLPPLAVLAGRAVGDVRWARESAIVSLAAAVPLLGMVTAVAVVKFPEDAARYTPIFWAFLPSFAAGLGAYAVATFLGRPGTGVVLLAGLTVLAYGLAIVTTARIWDQVTPWRQLARIVNAQDAPGAHVVVLGSDNEFLDFYVTKPVEYVREDGLARDWTRAPLIAIVPEQTVSRLPASPRPIVLGRAPTGLVVVANGSPTSR
jgi:4-amino-4-deoxy-L-arabinose transferase-like glycosyltransferase